MKINRNYWVVIDKTTGHIWNDCTHGTKVEAEAEINFISTIADRNRKDFKLKKIRIVDALRKQEEEG